MDVFGGLRRGWVVLKGNQMEPLLGGFKGKPKRKPFSIAVWTGYGTGMEQNETRTRKLVILLLLKAA